MATERQTRRAAAKTWLGFRSSHFARSTGTLVVVVDAVEQGLSDGQSDYRWAAVCDDHGRIVTTETLALATSAAAEPEGWCGVCNGSEEEA